MKRLFSILLIQLICWSIWSTPLSHALAPQTQTPINQVQKSWLDQAQERLLFLKKQPFPEQTLQYMEQSSPQGREFVQWARSVFRKIFHVSLFFGLSGFAINTIFLVFIIAGKMTPLIAIVWLALLMANLVFRALFEQRTQLLYEGLTLRLSQLLKKEKVAFQQSKVFPSGYDQLDPVDVSSKLTLWKLGQSYFMIDFVIGVVASAVAISLFNPLFVLPYLFALSVFLALVLAWATKRRDSRMEYYSEIARLDSHNDFYLSLSQEHRAQQSSRSIEQHTATYLHEKTKINVILRTVILAVLPLLGIVVFFALNVSLAPFLFYVFSLQLLGLFGLLDMVTSMHRGIPYEQQMSAFFKDLAQSSLYVQQSEWESQRNGQSANLEPSRQASLELSDFSLQIEPLKQSQEHRVMLKDLNLRIDAGEVYGITGPSGSGKTTLLQVLAARLNLNRKANVNDFEIRLQGHLAVRDFKGQLNTVSPENISFENLREGYASAGRFKIRSLLSYVQFSDVWKFTQLEHLTESEQAEVLGIARIVFPQKNWESYSSFLSFVKGSPSDGERSRIKLAAALGLNHSRFLCLDQPLVNLDPASERRALNLIRSYAKAHQVAVIIAQPELPQAKFAQIWDLDVAKIIEQSA